jgi:hypothetical protein
MPEWERGYRCHGYWIGIDRVGFVGLPPAFATARKDGYFWHATPPDSTERQGWEPTLRKAKRSVERTYRNSVAGKDAP